MDVQKFEPILIKTHNKIYSCLYELTFYISIKNIILKDSLFYECKIFFGKWFYANYAWWSFALKGIKFILSFYSKYSRGKAQLNTEDEWELWVCKYDSYHYGTP